MKHRDEVMKHLPLIVIFWIILGHATALAQSGRRSTKPAPAPTPSPVEEVKEKPAKPSRPEIAAVPNEEYKCVDDGSLAVVVSSTDAEKVFAPNEVTVKAKLLSRPKPEYTAEARRRAVEGGVTVRVVVLKSGKVSTVKITGRGGPFGLNESAIHAACKMEFAPASKDGERVSQWFKTEIVFRLGSSIGR
ncbi:MAG TPA: TonB family protein [Pyrinomonadaceae bacterium]|nr:TonB family protein [Pyrinomonadaceae bacterium]